MICSRNFLLGLAVLGLRAGLATAADPETPPAPAILQPPTTGVTLESDPRGSTSVERSGIIGGVGLYVIQPYFNNNMAFGLVGTANRSAAFPADPPGTRFTSRVDISHHMEAAPLAWLGYLSEDGLGARARCWYFRQGTEQSATGTGPGLNGVMIFASAPLGLSLIDAASGQGASSMTVTSKLQLHVLDLDALYDVGACNWSLLFAGGLRLGWIDQTYNAFTREALLSSNDFFGVGPTLAAEVRRPVGCTGLSLYGSARGSILFGSAEQTAAIPDRNVVARSSRDIGLPVAEAEVGLEYGRTVGCSHVFGQVGLVGQEWFGAGSASRSSVDVIPGGAFSTSAYVGDSDIAFLGLFIRLGVNY